MVAVARWLWRAVLGALTLAVLMLWASAAMLPRAWQVEAARVVPAPAHAVSAHLSGHGAVAALLRPNTPASAVDGASHTYRWSSEPDADHLTVHTTPDERTRSLIYTRSLEHGWAASRGDITLRPLDDGTTAVTWREAGSLPPPLGGLFRSPMQTAVSGALHDALARLDAETAPR